MHYSHTWTVNPGHQDIGVDDDAKAQTECLCVPRAGGQPCGFRASGHGWTIHVIVDDLLLRAAGSRRLT